MLLVGKVFRLLLMFFDCHWKKKIIFCFSYRKQVCLIDLTVVVGSIKETCLKEVSCPYSKCYKTLKTLRKVILNEI
jgi:hypothetical protein